MFIQNMGVGQTGYSDHELGESEGCSVWSRFTKIHMYSIFMSFFGKAFDFRVDIQGHYRVPILVVNIEDR